MVLAASSLFVALLQSTFLTHKVTFVWAQYFYRIWGLWPFYSLEQNCFYCTCKLLEFMGVLSNITCTCIWHITAEVIKQVSPFLMVI